MTVWVFSMASSTEERMAAILRCSFGEGSKNSNSCRSALFTAAKVLPWATRERLDNFRASACHRNPASMSIAVIAESPLPMQSCSSARFIAPTGARTLRRMSPEAASFFGSVQNFTGRGYRGPNSAFPWMKGSPIPSSLTVLDGGDCPMMMSATPPRRAVAHVKSLIFKAASGRWPAMNPRPATVCRTRAPSVRSRDRRSP